MKRLLPPALAAIVLATSAPAFSQFSPGMSPEEIRQEVVAQLQARPMVDVVRAMAEAGLKVETILAGLVALIGQPGYESVSVESIVQATIVAGLPPPAVVTGVIAAVEAKFGDVGGELIEAVISSAVAADVAVNGSAADTYAIAQAAADTGKITLPEASAIAGAAEVAALTPSTTAPVEEIEPVVSTR